MSCFKKEMIFFRSAGSATPPNMAPMLFPGMRVFGLVIHLSSVGSSQVIPDPLTDFGICEVGDRTGLASHHAV